MEWDGGLPELAATAELPLVGAVDTLQRKSRSEVLNASLHRGVLSIFKTQKEIRATLDQSSALRQIDKSKQEFQNKSENLEALRGEKELQRKRLAVLERDSAKCQSEIDQLRREIPTELKRRQQETILRKRHEVVLLSAEQQRTTLRDTEQRFDELDKLLDRLQLELSRSESLEQELRMNKAASEYEQSVKAEESLAIRKRAELRVKHHRLHSEHIYQVRICTNF
jgi:DNA repair exonuclease SbcCD ATPase subunit